MNNIQELDNLIQEINAEVTEQNLEKLPDSKAYHYIEWSDYLKKIKIQLKKNKYKFVFIGQKGVGKTTSILELFGLSKHINSGKFVDLLATGAGGTTTCEVELFRSETDYTYFEIEPISDALFNQYFDDFCILYDDSEIKSDDSQYLPTEISRSIRNMIGLKKSEIMDVRKACTSLDEFKAELLNRINKEERIETIIRCESQMDGFFDDCRKKFSEINLCKIKNVFLPGKINIYLTKDILDFDKYEIIHSIVDTRGIDTVISSGISTNKMKREDILNYIDKEQDNCLFFFIDSIKPAPSQNITDLLKTRLTNGNGFQFYIITNIVGNEAEEVMTDDGKAEFIDEGIKYKQDDILSKFRQINMPFIDNNLLFFNARMNIPMKDELIKAVNDNIVARYASAYKICDEIKIAFEKSKYDFENIDYALENFDQLKDCVEGIKSPSNIFDRIRELFFSELRSIHPARIAAINRNYGEYYAFDFFHEISLLIETLFDDCFSKSKEQITNKVNEFLAYRNISELDKLNYKIFIEKFEMDYNEYRSQLKDFLKDKIKEKFSSKTWDDAIEEWGMGSGYRDRVLEIYKNALNDFAHAINVKTNYDDKWDKIIRDNALES